MHMLCRLATVLLVACAAAGAAASPARSAEGLTVFAAASLKDALETTGAAFTAETGVPVVFSFAGTSNLARQIEAGAPADVFISADRAWMDLLEATGSVDQATIRSIAGNSLVVVAPANAASALDLTPEALGARLGDGRLAIADPDTVPAGRYGKAALTALGLWNGIAGQLAPMENVRVALATVARGEAPLGIVYFSDAAAEPDVAVVARFPEDSHPPIIYPAAVTKAAKPNAIRFLEFLQEPAARAAFAAAGRATLD